MLNKEIGYERENGSYKIGDGIHNWNDLPYANINLKELVGEKTKDGGEIFNDYERNIASGIYSHAEGYYTQAGTLAFNLKDHQYSDADYTNAEKTTGKYYLNTVEGIITGIKYTIVLTNNYDCEGTVISVGEDYIEVDNYLLPNSDTGSTINSNSYILFPENPEIQGDKIIGTSAHAEGCDTIASGEYQHVQGKYNVEDTEGKYADIVGGGFGDGYLRKNIQTTDWYGNFWTSGNIYMGGSEQNEGKEVATKDYVNLMINNLHYYCNKDIIYDESLFVIENKVLTIDCSNITDGRLVVPYTIGTHTEVIVIAPENITKIIIPRGIKLTNNVEMTDEALVEMFINLNTIVRIHEDGAVLSFNIAEGGNELI